MYSVIELFHEINKMILRHLARQQGRHARFFVGYEKLMQHARVDTSKSETDLHVASSGRLADVHEIPR